MRRAYVVCLIQILIQLSATTLLLCQSNRVPPLSPIATAYPISVHEALTRDGSASSLRASSRTMATMVGKFTGVRTMAAF